MLQTKITSSLEKCFLDDSLLKFPQHTRETALPGMHLSFQLLYRESDTAFRRTYRYPKLSGTLAPYTTLRTVEQIPSSMPVYPDISDANYVKTAPGLYPDLLLPLRHKDHIAVYGGQARSLWIGIDLPKAGMEPGEYTLNVTLEGGEDPPMEETITVELLGTSLPELAFPVTQWFHFDCLADYYHVPVFSERHWEILENFLKNAVKNGISLLLTPIFTPPLDTHVGGERPTVQLVEVEKKGVKYTFSYEKLDRWIDLCDQCGVKFFEIAHLFTQWGAEHAPKIIARVDGEEKKIFGWETDATGDDYIAFLEAFLPDFLSHMKARGDDKRCIFHISDEPNPKHIENYRKAKAVVSKYLEGYTTMDALSNYAYHEEGLVETPVVAINHIEPFLEHKVENLWAYYCCGQGRGTSNRFFAMPGWRTRAIGAQMYYYDIKGFLQWGYNFYYNQGSYDLINPYIESTGEGFFPSGDGYSVYPAPDGTAYDSIRILQFREALEDIAVMQLLEKKIGKEKVKSLLEKALGEITFSRCPLEAKEVLNMRELLLEELK